MAATISGLRGERAVGGCRHQVSGSGVYHYRLASSWFLDVETSKIHIYNG